MGMRLNRMLNRFRININVMFVNIDCVNGICSSQSNCTWCLLYVYHTESLYYIDLIESYITNLSLLDYVILSRCCFGKDKNRHIFNVEYVSQDYSL